MSIADLSSRLERLSTIYLEGIQEYRTGAGFISDQSDFILLIKPEVLRLQEEIKQGRTGDARLDRCVALYWQLKEIFEISDITSEQAKKEGRCGKFIEIASNTVQLAKSVFSHIGNFMNLAMEDYTISAGIGLLALYPTMGTSALIAGGSLIAKKYLEKSEKKDFDFILNPPLERKSRPSILSTDSHRMSKTTEEQKKPPQQSRRSTVEEKKDLPSSAPVPTVKLVEGRKDRPLISPQVVCGRHNQYNIVKEKEDNPGISACTAISARAVIEMLKDDIYRQGDIDRILEAGIRDYRETLQKRPISADESERFPHLGWGDIQLFHPSISQEVTLIDDLSSRGALSLEAGQEKRQFVGMMQWLARFCPRIGQKIGGIFTKQPETVGIVLENVGQGRYKIAYFNPHGEGDVKNCAVKRTFDSFEEFAQFLYEVRGMRYQGGVDPMINQFGLYAISNEV
jgi:hypothetical protein